LNLNKILRPLSPAVAPDHQPQAEMVPGDPPPAAFKQVELPVGQLNIKVRRLGMKFTAGLEGMGASHWQHKDPGDFDDFVSEVRL